MNHGMTEGLRKSLADLRENEERCRDAALAIQRVLEAEGALYPPALVQAYNAEVQKVKALFAGPVAKPETGWPTATAVVTLDQPAPGAEKQVSRKGAKAQRLSGEKKPPAVKAGGMDSRACVICGKTFKPNAGVQKACSPKCVAEKNRRYALEKYHAKQAAKKAPAPTAKQERTQAGGQTRIERIKALTGFVDPIPQRVRDAAAEARESENMG